MFTVDIESCPVPGCGWRMRLVEIATEPDHIARVVAAAGGDAARAPPRRPHPSPPGRRTDPPPDELAESAVFVDTTGDLHRRIGASAECASLLRPDGYVAYRSQLARLQDRIAYLERVRR